MAIDLLSIQPHKVSRDLSGYITYLFSKPKLGKTSLVAKAPKSLILATEIGYNAIEGVRAVNINSWADIKAVVKELKKPEVQEMYSIIAVDTIDKAAAYCEKYICAQNGIEDLSELGYGKAYKKMRAEFEEVFDTMTKLGYAVFFIGHEQILTLTREDGSTYNRIIPSLSPEKVNAIIENMADIYCYGKEKATEDDRPNERVLVMRDNTGMVSCGCRFEHMAHEIPMSYESLVSALNEAIDKANDPNVKPVDTVPVSTAKPKPSEHLAELKQEFNAIVKKLQNDDKDKFASDWAPKITAIRDKTLGKGKRIDDISEEQTELLEVIISDLKDAVQG